MSVQDTVFVGGSVGVNSGTVTVLLALIAALVTIVPVVVGYRLKQRHDKEEVVLAEQTDLLKEVSVNVDGRLSATVDTLMKVRDEVAALRAAIKNPGSPIPPVTPVDPKSAERP